MSEKNLAKPFFVYECFLLIKVFTVLQLNINEGYNEKKQKGKYMKNKGNNSILYSAIVIVIVLISVISGKVVGNKDNNDSTTQQITTEAVTTEEITTQTIEIVTTEDITTEAKAGTEEESTQAADEETEADDSRPLTFRNSNRLDEHYEKHGIEMGFSSAEEYEAAARKVVLNKNALHKIEVEDGDDVYYLEATNEFVIVSPDGYIRTYFNPSGGIDYYNRQ